MRCLGRNKRKLKYSLLVDTETIEIEVKGKKIKTGEDMNIYSDPIEFLANFSMSGGDAQAVEFGVDLSQYDATITTQKGLIPITETSLIWFESEPIFKDGRVDPKSADYKVVKLNPTLNFDKYILKRLVK